jgi:hypothetical protein
MSEEINFDEINIINVINETESIITNVINENESIITNVINEPEPEPVITTSTIILKPYRIIKYDDYDKKYATHMKSMYRNVDTNIKEQFDIFTENLLDDNYINRTSLIDAIYQFTSYTNNNNAWNLFTDAAFNYRPWQPCCIS